MGSLFRSEDMTLCQLFLQAEAAYACVSELGELGLVQFRDLNPDVNAFQRKFVNEVRRCDEMERKLRFLEKEIKKDGIPMLDTGDNPESPQPREMIDLEATFEKLESEMNDVNANTEALKRNFLELTELKHILRKTQTFFDEAEHRHIQAMHEPMVTDENIGLLGEEVARTGHALKLGFVAGVILRERIPAFERMLWRVCRGNVFLKQAEIDTPLEDPVTGDQVMKSVFIIFFQGDQLKSRVKKICEGFRATLYPCPETQSERREMAMGVMTRIEDLNTVLGQTQDHRHRLLVAAAKNIKVWFIKVHKIKAIYHTLNMFNLDVTQKCLIAECWCPVADLDRIQQALQRGTERSGSSVPSILNRMSTKQEPPTYNRTNKFTSVFQSIVDAYGVASYREVNPAPYTVITFPFLFAIMFGDAGHGVIMLLFAIFLVLREKQLAPKATENEIFGMIFNGRYIMLLMGGFSVYTGIVYNDIFSKSLFIFQSAWYPNPAIYRKDMDLANYKISPNSSNFIYGAYPFGLDPVWAMAINKISFTNSFKMKVSVVFGVAHMMFGIALSLFNHRYFKRPLNIYFEFIPQLVFLNCIFGYLIILIFAKWLSFTEEDSYDAPNLLIGLINMFLMNYPDKGPKSNMTFYSGQKGVQIFLVMVALACVPVLLFAKPYFMWKESKNPQRNRYRLLNGGGSQDDGPEIVHHDDIENPGVEDEEEEEKLSVNSGDLINNEREVLHHGEGGGGGDVEQATAGPSPPLPQPFDLADCMINQAIHTIEYCLGCISHTASYLRLWALSLAHAQLSEVLWSMVMQIAFSIDMVPLAIVVIIVAFAFWAGATIIILVGMEGMSAFLHALRLHWVEFQSKFYKGEGYLFVPFSFDNVMEYGIEEGKR